MRASGEMDEASFTTSLKDSHGAAATLPEDGSIAFVCLDWRPLREVRETARWVFNRFKKLCVWNKTKGDMGHSAILSMDSCNHGYDAGISGLSEAGGLGNIQLAADTINAGPTTSGAGKFPFAASVSISLSSVRSDTALRSRSFNF